MANKLPKKWSELDPEETEKIRKYFPSWPLNDLIKYEPGPVILPRTFLTMADEIYNFELREDDIWIVTYPKVGTTWSQEIIWMLVNNVDKEAGAKPLDQRTPFLEIGCHIAGRNLETMDLDPEVLGNEKNMVKLKEFTSRNDLVPMTNDMQGRRVIKCHLPMEFLPPKILETCKVVYVCRNVKDTCASYFNFLLPHDFLGDFEDFSRLFKEELHLYGSYWHHLHGGWELRNEKNLKFIWYEDLKRDTKGIIEELCEFLEHPLSEEKIDELVDHVHIDNMRKNPWINPPKSEHVQVDLIRKGNVGDSKNYFTPEKAEEWNKWIEEKTKGSGIKMTI